MAIHPNIGTIPDETDARRIYLSHLFGRLLFYMSRTPAISMLDELPQDVRSKVEGIIDEALNGAMDLLDGVIPRVRNEELDVEFALIARLHDVQTKGDLIRDEVELAPNGEGLGMGYAMWRDGEFGTTPPWEFSHIGPRDP